LTPIARKRLAAIREFSDLGAGFRIAALDLELRGGGNLLGGQQSGHIDAIGFDLYCQMLERTVNELRGEDIVEEITTQLNLGVDTRIPDEYINDMSQRLRTYKRIASARDDAELAKIKDEIADRCGRLTESVENLFAYAKVRREAESLGILAIDRIADSLSIRLSEKARVNPEALMKLLADNPNARFAPNGVLKVKMNEDDDLARRVFGTLGGLLDQLMRS
jgi:transcription-repair coupling factor (superfamily II helicase)